MFFIGTAAFMLITAAVVLLFKLTPAQIGKDIFSLLHSKPSLKNRVLRLQGKKKIGRIELLVNSTRSALEATGSEKKFGQICTAALAGVLISTIIAIVIDNVLMIPVFTAICIMLPFVYAQYQINLFNQSVATDLETALSIITTSYIAYEDIIFAIESNVDYIAPSIRPVFKRFLGQTKLINGNIIAAISNMKRDLNNEIFHEWCDNLTACIDNVTMKHVLQPITAKLSDLRIINAELNTILLNPRKEFMMMLIVLLLNFPILYFLNPDWFAVLTDTWFGKAVCGIIGIVCVVTSGLAIKRTQPIKYRR